MLSEAVEDALPVVTLLIDDQSWISTKSLSNFDKSALVGELNSHPLAFRGLPFEKSQSIDAHVCCAEHKRLSVAARLDALLQATADTQIVGARDGQPVRGYVPTHDRAWFVELDPHDLYQGADSY